MLFDDKTIDEMTDEEILEKLSFLRVERKQKTEFRKKATKAKSDARKSPSEKVVMNAFLDVLKKIEQRKETLS